MMQPFVPEDALKQRGDGSAPVARMLDTHDLIPGMPDTPWFLGNYFMHDEVDGWFAPACCTFWRPSLDERVVLATGGCVQVLTYAPPPPPVVSVGAALINELPTSNPHIEMLARTLYEIHNGEDSPPFKMQPEETQRHWYRIAVTAWKMVIYWTTQTDGPTT